MKFKKFGKYTIIKKLASGGMADILLVADLSPTGFGRFNVIKRALSKFSNNNEFIEMFKNEGKIACNLKHRNITPVYEFGVEKSQFFLCMEYISGRNLRELVKKLKTLKSKISVPDAVYIVREVASGLNYAHNAIDSNTGQPLNLIHRDVSPQNIMLSFEGEVKLVDFGIAKIADTNLTRAGHLKGKFSYMSPEQACGERLDERTDIFCLGIILWELLTSERLFASKNEFDSLKKIRNCNIPSAQKINPSLSPILNDIVSKALNKNRNLRYRTAAKMEKDLNLFLNKSYPEYSSYDFTSLMKNIYRKEIMKEREDLKLYASEFKKFHHALNMEEHPAGVSLDIPTLSSVTKEKYREEKPTASKRESALGLKNKSAVSQYASSSSGSRNQETTENSQKTEGDETTLVQQQTASHFTNGKNTKTRPLHTHNEGHQGGTKTLPHSKDETGASQSLRRESLILNQDDFFQMTKSFDMATRSGKTAFQKKSIFKERLEERAYEKKRKLGSVVSFFLVFFLIGAFFSFSYWVLDNQYDIIGFLKDKKTAVAKKTQSKGGESSPAAHNMKPQALPKGSSSTSASAQNPPSTQAVAERKVMIQSNPSGASIWINNKASRKLTPSLIYLSASKTTIITVRKEGYLPNSFVFDPSKSSNNQNITLKNRGISSKKPRVFVQ